MIAVIDYGAGNLFSIHNALKYLDLPHMITRDKAELEKADELILPGVGAFPDAMKLLSRTGLSDAIREQAQRKPLLGICLGLQMLFEESDEFEQTSGLGLIPGKVSRIQTSLKIPHMGWNHLRKNGDSPLLSSVSDGSSVYFVHSYMAYTSPENVTAYCEYGTDIPALVERGNIFGAQFHPEKSGETGLTILRNFGGLTK